MKSISKRILTKILLWIISFLIIILLCKLFNYPPFSKYDLIVVNDKDATFLHELFRRSKKIEQITGRFPQNLEELTNLEYSTNDDDFKKSLKYKEANDQLRFYSQHSVIDKPDSIRILATDEDANDLNKLKVLYFDGRVERHDRSMVELLLNILKESG